jgi:acetyltransferase-like isoleucine patch superfamily enzyme
MIGNNVGMSNTTIVATKSITIGNNIMIGGGVTIVDSDFHSLNSLHWHTNADEKNMISLPVVIKDNVFIGMDSIILKGVTIGNNVIIAAGSVVSKDLPNNQIWGGNPARFIRNNEFN